MGAFSRMTSEDRHDKSASVDDEIELIDGITFIDGYPILPQDLDDDNEEWRRFANERLYIRQLLNGWF